jgi:hypothetical protein
VWSYANPITITISGGTIYATGGSAGGAGIGNGLDGMEYTINITGGTITATGGGNGAGIGTALDTGADYGTINIIGGTDGSAAGIGGGIYAAVNQINISGGTIYAEGSSGGPGIGTGGSDAIGSNPLTPSQAGSINITGGTITAIGKGTAAGIGSGYNSHGPTISLSGGLVYTDSEAGAYDIGPGNASVSSGNGSLTLDGTVAVFLENNTTITPVLNVPHDHTTPTSAVNPLLFSGNTVYGLTVDSSWKNVDGGYFILSNVFYDANGGSGVVPATSKAQHAGTVVTVADSNALSYSGRTFVGWNTAADGSGQTCAAGASLTLWINDVTLYAQWSTEVPPTGDSSMPLALPIILAMLAGAGIAMAAKFRKGTKRA